MLSTIIGALLYLFLISTITAGLFFWDKHRAINGGWRIPENTLLGLAILGGSIGAKFAQIRGRHKTQKQPFATLLNLICFAQLALILALIIPQTRAFLLSSL